MSLYRLNPGLACNSVSRPRERVRSQVDFDIARGDMVRPSERKRGLANYLLPGRAISMWRYIFKSSCIAGREVAAQATPKPDPGIRGLPS